MTSAQQDNFMFLFTVSFSVSPWLAGVRAGAGHDRAHDVPGVHGHADLHHPQGADGPLQNMSRQLLTLNILVNKIQDHNYLYRVPV